MLAGETVGANWGFNRLISAIIIVSAVVFGLACGTVVGCLLVKLISLQQERRSGASLLVLFGVSHSMQHCPYICLIAREAFATSSHMRQLHNTLSACIVFYRTWLPKY